jgi:phosphoserine phosphatase RsbX
MSGSAPALLDYGVAARSLTQSIESGDLHTVQENSEGVLIGVADGLGHGVEAAVAARAAIAELEARPREPVTRLIEQCHQALKKTRGAVLLLASLDAREKAMTWISVGNVEGLILHADRKSERERDYVLTQGGIIGHRMPTPHPTTVPLDVGDLLIFATDGIRGGFAEGLRRDRTPQAIADDLLARYGKTTDDALVLVARWNGLAGVAP